MNDSELREAAYHRGFPIDDIGMLKQALTHKSFVPHSPLECNERLEFLGDAVLGLVIAEYLCQTYPKRTEGELAKARSLIVCKSALAQAARRMNIIPMLQIGRAEEAMGGRERSGLAADAFEAIIAVIYLQSGYIVVRDFLLNALAAEISAIDNISDWRDPKTVLQEQRQAKHLPPPVYRVISEDGLPHNRTFVVEVLLDDEVLGIGSGKSKKTAEQAAAEIAMVQVGQNT